LLPITPAPITPTRSGLSVPALVGAADALETIYSNPEIDYGDGLSKIRALRSPSMPPQLWRMPWNLSETRFNSKNYDAHGRAAHAVQPDHTTPQPNDPARGDAASSGERTPDHTHER
jgi:hypothetical protein